MRTLLKAGLARAVAATGGIRRRHAGKLVVLTFHRVRPDGEGDVNRPMRNLEVDASDFRRLLAWMRERYEPVALADGLARDEAPDRASFAVTFDDGWADNHAQALPVLRELEIPATVFLATGAVEDRMPFGWQEAGWTDAEIERRKLETPAALECTGRGDPVRSTDFLTWEQIRDMGDGGLIRFGPHGHRHALLDALSKEDALEDIRQCWRLLQERVPGMLAPVLAWPNGNARTDLAEDLQAMGLRAAMGTGRGAFTTPAQHRWNLPRNNVDRNLAREPGLWNWLLLRA